MKLGEINPNLKPIEASLFLCKPDKKTIAKLTEAHEVNYSTKLGSLNEISFKIPTMIEKDRVPITNPNIKDIKHRYLFKLIYGSTIEYFQFNERSKGVSNDEYVEYKALSLGTQLADKNIRAWSVESKNLSYMMNDILKFSKWKVGYVDSAFDLKYRSHEIASQTALQATYELAEKFNAVIKWDTVNLKINFYRPENVGTNKGLRFKKGKYLDSMTVSSDSNETITRLKLYGKDGLTIRNLSATGSNYIEDFSYYMFPFKRDKNGTVTSESDYMSNELCIALENYKALLSSKQGEFDTLTKNLTLKQDEIQQEEQKLSVLQTELVKILDERDILNSQFLDGTPAHQAVILRMNEKNKEIDAKMIFISSLDAQERNIINQISILNSLVATENNLSPSQLLELNDFIIEKEYTNDAIVDEQDLLDEGYEVFKEFREPKISMTLNIINFLSIVEAQNDWGKLVLGDTVVGKHNRMDIDIQAKIIEINYSFESKEISLTIANEKEIKDNAKKLMDLLYNAGNTSTVVNMDKYKWNLAEENNGMINDIINNKWDAIKNSVIAGYEQQIEMSERGIIVRSLEDPNTWLVIQNGMLAITNDSGNSWKHAITSEGIVGERIYGKIISGVNLAIEDASGVWITRGSRTTIYDRAGKEQMRLGLVTDDPKGECFGMLLDNGRHRVHATSCDGFMIEKKVGSEWVKKMYANLDGEFWVEDFTAKNLTAIDDDGYFKFEGNKGTVSDGANPVMWLGYIPYGSVPMCSPSTDFGTILKGTNNSLIYMTKNRGFAIDVDCVNKFKVDTDGSLYAQDLVTHNLKIVNGELGEKIILDQNTGITINGNKGEQIRLNANEGIAIDVNGENRMWLGTDGMLYARRLIVLNEDFDEAILDEVTGSYISDLTVNKLRTLNSNVPQDHVFIKDNFIQLNTGFADNTARTKFELTLKGTGESSYPHSTWGAGDANGNDKGFLYKTGDTFSFEYKGIDGNTRKIAMNDSIKDSILLETPHDIRTKGKVVRIEVDANNYIELSSSGVTIKGTAINLN